MNDSCLEFFRLNKYYADAWMAGTNKTKFQKVIKRDKLENIDVPQICEHLEHDTLYEKALDSELPEIDSVRKSTLSLKVAANLMCGAIRIWSAQVRNLYERTESTLAVQASYNAILRSATIEEDRRKSRINYVEMLSDGLTSNKKKKKHTAQSNVEFTWEDLEHVDQLPREEENDLNEDFMNLVIEEDITLRDNYLGVSGISSKHDIAMDDMEPMTENELKLLMTGDPEPSNDWNCDTDSHMDYMIRDDNYSNFEQPADISVPLEIMNSYQHKSYLEVPLTSHDSEICNITEWSTDLTPIPMDIDIPTVLQTTANQSVSVNQISVTLESKDLPALDAESIKQVAKKQPASRKRKIDDVLNVPNSTMLERILDWSDTISKRSFAMPPKKLRYTSETFLLKNPSHLEDGSAANELLQLFRNKINYLSASDAKKRALKRKISPIEESPNKRQRTSMENTTTEVICDTTVARKSQIPVELPEIEPINANFQNVDVQQPELDPQLNIIIEDLNDNSKKQGTTEQSSSQEAMEVDVQEWRYIKKEFGQAGVIKKLVRIFRKDIGNGIIFDTFIKKTNNRKIIVMVFSSLIHLKAKLYVELEKDERLYITIIREGIKLLNVLRKL